MLCGLASTAPCFQAEAQDELARLRAELTAALALGGGGGRVDVASVVLGPRRSGGALAGFCGVGARTAAATRADSEKLAGSRREASSPACLQVTAAQGLLARRLQPGAACASGIRPSARCTAAARQVGGRQGGTRPCAAVAWLAPPCHRCWATSTLDMCLLLAPAGKRGTLQGGHKASMAQGLGMRQLQDVAGDDGEPRQPGRAAGCCSKAAAAAASKHYCTHACLRGSLF